jgi:hypothetical protein
MKYIFALLAFCVLTSGKCIQAQSAITTAGTSASGSGGSVSFTIGQISYTINSGASGSVAQGVQQPYEISVVTEIVDNPEILLEIIAYPNPATDQIRVKTGDNEVLNYQYRLYDTRGILLLTGKIDEFVTIIDIGHLKPASYLISITDGGVAIKTFRIIKN